MLRGSVAARACKKAIKYRFPASVTESQRDVWSYPGICLWQRYLTRLLQASLMRLRGYANRIPLPKSGAQCKARVAAPDNPKKQKYPRLCQQGHIKNQSPEANASGLSGAATRIRTGDLILTKDVLYQLSHSSVPQEYFLVTLTIISNIFLFVNTFLKKMKKYLQFIFIAFSFVL